MNSSSEEEITIKYSGKIKNVLFYIYKAKYRLIN